MVQILCSAAVAALSAAEYGGGRKRIVFVSFCRAKVARLSPLGSESHSPGCRRQAWHLDKIYNRRRQDRGSVLVDP